MSQFSDTSNVLAPLLKKSAARKNVEAKAHYIGFNASNELIEMLCQVTGTEYQNPEQAGSGFYSGLGKEIALQLLESKGMKVR